MPFVSAVVTPPSYSDWQLSAGPYCNDHRSMYCEHALDYISQRTDASFVRWALTGEGPYDGWNHISPVDMHMVVPVFPEYCVWEQLYYEVKNVEPLGPLAELSPDYKKRDDLQGVRRLLPGESAGDLAMTLRQQFEDDCEFYRDRYINGWKTRCTSSSHGVKYNNVAMSLLQPHVIQGAIDDNRDRVLVYSNLYCYLRHQRCLFCYVNENFRDAVRVNPELAGFLQPEGSAENTGSWEDLIP